MTDMTPTQPLEGVRIVIVNNFPGAALGGGEVLLLHVLRGLQGAGADATAVVMPGSGFGDRLRARSVAVVESRMTAGSVLAAVATIRGACQGARPCALFGTGYFTSILVRLAARRLPGVSVVNLAQVVPGASLVDAGSRVGAVLRRWIDRSTVGRVDVFIAVSQAVAEALATNGAPRDRIHVVPNSVDIQALERSAEGPTPEGIPGGAGPLVVCAARLEVVKGVEHLLRALAQLPGVRLIVAGDGPLRAALADLAAELGIADRVALLGYVEHVPQLMAAADLVVLSSLSEGLPTVALEAMALGRAVVATRVGGVPEAVDAGVTGLLVPPADPKALADAIRSLLADPERAARMGEAGRQRVAERFSAQTMADEYVAVLSGLIDLSN